MVSGLGGEAEEFEGRGARLCGRQADFTSSGNGVILEAYRGGGGGRRHDSVWDCIPVESIV